MTEGPSAGEPTERTHLPRSARAELAQGIPARRPFTWHDASVARTPLHETFPSASPTSFSFRPKKKPSRPVPAIVWEDDEYLLTDDPAAWTVLAEGVPARVTYIATTGRNGGGGGESALLLAHHDLEGVRSRFLDPKERWRTGDDWALTGSLWTEASGAKALGLFEVVC